MRTSLRYPLLLSVPPGLALGVAVYVFTGRALLALGAGFLVGLVFFSVVLLGTEVGSTNLDPE